MSLDRNGAKGKSDGLTDEMMTRLAMTNIDAARYEQTTPAARSDHPSQSR
jgi:hypothetical protein